MISTVLLAATAFLAAADDRVKIDNEFVRVLKVVD
jgi:hypothetical protein